MFLRVQRYTPGTNAPQMSGQYREQSTRRPLLPRLSFGNQLPQRIESTRLEWMRTDDLYGRLRGGAVTPTRNDSSIHLDDSELSDPHSPKSISTFSLQPPSAAGRANSDISSTADANAVDCPDSGYGTPNPTSSTVGGVRSDSMAPSISSLPSSFSPSDLSCPPLSSGPSSTIASDSRSQDQRSIIVGAAMLDPDGQELALDTGPRFSRGGHTHTYPQLHCPFNFLKCRFMTSSQSAWLSHTLVHFQNKPLPRTAFCPLCGGTFEMPAGGCSADRKRVWDRKMRCLYGHLSEGWTFEHGRPDFGLFKHLWQKEIINVNDYQELVQNSYRKYEPQPVVTKEGRSRSGAEHPRRAG